MKSSMRSHFKATASPLEDGDSALWFSSLDTSKSLNESFNVLRTGVDSSGVPVLWRMFLRRNMFATVWISGVWALTVFCEGYLRNLETTNIALLQIFFWWSPWTDRSTWSKGLSLGSTGYVIKSSIRWGALSPSGICRREMRKSGSIHRHPCTCGMPQWFNFTRQLKQINGRDPTYFDRTSLTLTEKLKTTDETACYMYHIFRWTFALSKLLGFCALVHEDVVDENIVGRFFRIGFFMVKKN